MHHSRGGACAHASDVATGRHGVNALRMNVGGGLAGIGWLLLLLLLLVIEHPCGALAGIVLLLLLLLLRMVLVVVGRPCYLGLVLMVNWLSLAIIVVWLALRAVIAWLGAGMEGLGCEKVHSHVPGAGVDYS